MSIHPAAAPFPRDVRERVAGGPLFNVRLGEMFVRDSDHYCVWTALLLSPYPGTVEVSDADVRDLAARNDAGRYADRAALVRDLLGSDPEE